MASKLRIGVLGCGMISFDHLTAWSREERAKVVAVCDPDSARAADRAEAFNIAEAYCSAEEMISSGKIDALDIITPRQTHADLILLAAEYGLPVLCEKPVTPTHAETGALIAAIGGRTRVMVNENWRFRPYFRKIREWIDRRELGTITSCRMSLTRSSLLPDAEGSVPSLRRQPFVAREQRLVVAESLIHELDTLRYLVGEMVVERSMLSRTSQEVMGEDTAVILLRGAENLPAIVTGTMVAAGHAYRAGDRLEIHGSRASVTLDNAVLSLEGASTKRLTFDEAEARQLSFDYSIAHFVDCLLNNRAFETDISDQLHTMLLVEQAYELAGEITVRPMAVAEERQAAL
jgi:predicted dehydrogenase